MQSFMQAISLAAFVVASLVVLWFLSQTRLLQMTARETHLLHGTIALVKVTCTSSLPQPLPPHHTYSTPPPRIW